MLCSDEHSRQSPLSITAHQLYNVERRSVLKGSNSHIFVGFRFFEKIAFFVEKALMRFFRQSSPVGVWCYKVFYLRN
jgi:hypothetical protein